MTNYKSILISLVLLFIVSDLDAQRRSGRSSKRLDESKNIENVKESDGIHKKFGFSSTAEMVEFLLEKDLKRSDKRIVEKYGKGKKLSKSQEKKLKALLEKHTQGATASQSNRSGRVSGDRALTGTTRGSSASRSSAKGRSSRVGRSGRQATDMMDYDSTMTPVMHLLGGLDGFLNDKVADNKLDSDQVQPMLELANALEGATHSEWESDDNDGAAGSAMEAAEQYLNDNNIEQGVRDHFMQMLCMLEWEVHAEHQEGPPEEGPDCGMEMEENYTDAEYDCDPNGDYPAMDPGPDGGCGDYADCNGNGAFDVGEPCYEGYEGDDQGPSFEEVDANNDGEISYSEAQAVFGEEPDFDNGFSEVDANNDGNVDMGEWEAANNDENHGEEGEHGDANYPGEHGDANYPGEYDGDANYPGEHGDVDTHWADEAYQLNGQQDHYDRVMGVADEDREHEFNMIRDELDMGDEDIDCDPNGDYPVMDPGPEGGCADYADCNGNGVFDIGEPCYEGENQGPSFEEVDSNNDGEISYSEAQAVFGGESDFDERFNEVDSNNNGSVDMAEWQAAESDDDNGSGGE